MADLGQDEKAREPQRVGMREFRGNLAGFLRQVRQGASFLVMVHDQVLAEIRPPSSVEPPRFYPLVVCY